MVTRVPAPPPPGPTDDAAAHPLDDLAGELEQRPGPGEGTTDLDVAERAQQEADAKAMGEAINAMQAGVQALVLGGLRAVRTRLARGLPELLDEWPDAVLEAPAKASIPVINKYAAKWMPLLGNYPEEAALAMSLLPLTMGYMAAIDKHRAAVVASAPAPAGVQ